MNKAFHSKYRLISCFSKSDCEELWFASFDGPPGAPKAATLKLWCPFLECGQESPIKRYYFQATMPQLGLSHPGLLRHYEVGAYAGRTGVAREYLLGVSLAQVLRRCSLPMDLAVLVVMRLAEAVDYLHQSVGPHDDIHPGHVLLGFMGEVKLIGFQEAFWRGEHAATTSAAPFTFPEMRYSAPESLHERRVDPRGDLFSLGVLLYQLTTGHYPFERSHPVKTLEAIRNASISAPTRLNPNIPDLLERIIRKAMMRRPTARFQSAAAMVHALQEYRQKHNRRASNATLSDYLCAHFGAERFRGLRLKNAALQGRCEGPDHASAPYD